MSDSFQREEAIAEAAQHLPAPQRTSYLAETCGADNEMRQRVETRLLTHSGPAKRGVDNDATVGATTEGVVIAAEETPGEMIGRYKLQERIGEGGFGVVYIAEQLEPVKRRVALKITKLGMDTEQVVARFEAERQALAMMDHPNIAGVIDGGATPTGRPYFVMELVKGTKITEYCDHNKLSTRKRLDLFVQVCRAIDHAHQKGIVHRDIKPSNILVTIHDGAPVCKVIDFGIAKATQGNLADKVVHTQFDQFMGTPAYMSPEQAEPNGMEVDPRSDIYSLGVLLYELLTGHTPFESKNLLARGFDEMRRMIRELEPIRPSNHLDKQAAEELTKTAKRHGTEAPKLINIIRGDLDWVVMKCLEKDRARRYETAGELTAEIQRFLANEPVLARPPSELYRFQKLVMRNKIAFGAGAIVYASLVIGLGVTSWFVVKEKQERDLALIETQKANGDRKIAEAAREQSEVERNKAIASAKETKAALQQSEIDRAKAEAAEKKAVSSEAEAVTARQLAEAALHQSQTDRAKAEASDKNAKDSESVAQIAREQAALAETKAATEAGKSEEATKAAATEATLRQQAEAARQAAETARQQAEAAKTAAIAETTQLRGVISNAVTRLASLSPVDTVKAADIFVTPENEKEPWAVSFVRQRAEARARQEDWKDAIVDFSKVLDGAPDDIDSWLALGPLLAQNGELEACSRQCSRLLARFTTTNNPATPLSVKYCLIAPLPAADLSAAAALARQAITNNGALPGNQLAVGLAEYREGHYTEAADWAGKAVAGSAQPPACNAQAFALLAMSQFQLKQNDTALASLTNASQLVASKFPKPDDGDLGPDWRDWAIAQTLLREAAALSPPPVATK